MNKVIVAAASRDDFRIVIQNNGRFDFSVYSELRDAYKKNVGSYSYVIDLKKIDYVDSAALGMLLVLKEFADNNASKLKVVNCRPMVMKIFQVTNLEKAISFS